MPTRCVVVADQVVQKLLGPPDLECAVADVLRPADRRQRDPLVQVLWDRLDVPTEADERPDGREVSAERDLLEFAIAPAVVPFAPPHAVRVEIATAELAEIVDVLLLAPCDERPKAVLLRLDSRGRRVVLPGVEVESDRLIGLSDSSSVMPPTS